MEKIIVMMVVTKIIVITQQVSIFISDVFLQLWLYIVNEKAGENCSSLLSHFFVLNSQLMEEDG